MSEDVSKDDIEENKDQDEEEEEENNTTAAFANNVNTNRTNKSTKKAFGELTFSKGDDFIVESSPNNNLPNKDNIQQPQQNVKSVTFNNPDGINHQPFQFSNSNYNEISNIMNDQLLISKSSLLTNIKEVQAININKVNTVIANNANNNQIVNENKVKSEMMNVDNPQSNNESTKMKRNSMNSGFGEMWIPSSSLNNTLNNTNNNIIKENINLILSQEQPRPQIQIQSQPQPININQSLQMINKELDIITGNINESISGGRFYNKRNNYGCSCYDGSLLLRNSTNDYTQYTQNDIMTRKYNPNQPSHIHNSLSIPSTQAQIHNSYFNNNNNNNSVITSSRTISKTNSRVLYNIQDSSQTNLFT